jgi:hypothetical protein
MKTLKILFCVILSLWVCTITQAAFVPLRTDADGDIPETTILKQSAQEVQLEIRLPGIELSEGLLEGKRWDRVGIPGGGCEMDLGAPEVPHFSRLLIIPATASVQAQFEALEATTIPNIQLMPAQGNNSEDLSLLTPLEQGGKSEAVQFDLARYSRNELYPAQRVQVGEPAVMRGLRVVALRTNPVQYNPVTHELVVTTKYCVTISFQGQDLRNVPLRSVAMSKSWANLVKGVSFNFDENLTDEQNMGSYLIICVTGTQPSADLQPLIEWKRRKGHTVVLETVASGASNSAIKSVIQTAYNTWTTPPEFVLLVGEPGSGSYPLAGWSSSVDHPYSQLDGSDILADVAVGRMPTLNQTQTQTMVNKVLFYEKMPYTTSTSWYVRGALAAPYSNSLSMIQTSRWIKTLLLQAGYTQVDTLWPGMGDVPTWMRNEINNGVTYINYRGWIGMQGFGNDDIDQLINGRMLPFATIITCATGGFGDSAMEHFVTVGSPSLPKGAIACTGMYGAATEPPQNNCLNYGIYAGMFMENITQPGTAVVRGKLELYNAYQINNPGTVNSFSNWCALMGDPGVELFTGAIQYMTCSVPDQITYGVNTLALTVNQQAGGALEGATVCLYKANELQAVGQTDANGQITMPLNVLAAGNVKVTITKHNYHPLIDSLDVISAGVVVGYESHTIDDDNLGGTSGDGDHLLNPGETVDLPLIFKNYGAATTATGITATASEIDTFGTLTNATQSFPNLAPGASGSSSGALHLAVSPACPDDHIVPITFNTTSNQGNWPGLLNLTVASYHMEVLTIRAQGADTLLSPGESADLILSVSNEGHKDAINLNAVLVSLDTLVVVNDGGAGFGNVVQGAVANCTSNPFHVTASTQAPRGHWADLKITFSANGAAQTDTIRIKLGNKFSTDPQGPDQYGYYCLDNTDVGFGQAPVYSWVEIDPGYGGSGTQLPLNDIWEDQDQSCNVNLPFTFRYYGENTDRITVCTNGWLTLLANVSFTDFRNYHIPSPIGPFGQVCPFWDDLITSPGHVFAWSDETNHRYIIEWSRVTIFSSPQSSFQQIFEVILYDPVYYPTPTGDGEIVFQYNNIADLGVYYQYYYDNPFATVGIENQDQTIGLQVVYMNVYSDPATAPLQNGRAYKFTTALGPAGPPPVVGVNPTSLTINTPLNGSGSQPLSVTNSGGSILAFSSSFLVPGDAQGGPDAFGYTWKDSDEPGGPAFNWVDVSAIGAPLTFVHNDSTAAAVPLGFEFPYYGQMRTSIIVSANGWLSFTSHANAYNNTALPNPSAPGNLIAPFWDDLDPLQTGAQVLWWSDNADSFVVSFQAVPHWGSTVVGTYTFQAILTRDGDVTYQYQTLTGTYTNCTVGQQNADGADGLQVAYNQTYLHSNLAVKITHPFLMASPSGGAVAPGGSQPINVTAFAYGLAAGAYPASMFIDSNDPITPHLTVPVTVVVGVVPSPVEIILTPTSPPIVIPPGGGVFSYTVSVQNVATTPQTFDGWIMQYTPLGQWQGPMLGPVNLTIPVGVTLSRIRNQNVPSTAPAGVYIYRGYVGVYTTSVKWDSSSFTYTKSAAGDGAMVSNWENWGESFAPYENLPSASTEMPTVFSLDPCRPNPFNPTTTISYRLPAASFTSLKVYDISGRLVNVLVEGWQEAGTHQVTFEGSQLASGLYFVRMQAGEFKAVQKLILLK